MTPMSPCLTSLREFSLEEQAELAELLDRYLVGWEAGDPPSISPWVRDRPEMEDALRGYIQQITDLHGVLPPEGSECEVRESRRDAATGPNALGFNGPQGRLGDYHILDEIGRGGMGIVYRARQLSLGRDVAIKTLPFAAVLDPKQIKRFQNEAQAAAQLHHPNIVPVYAVGCERGVHYYSMQLIEGLSLEQVIADLRTGGKASAICHQTTLAQPAADEQPAGTPTTVTRAGETKAGQQSSTVASIRNRSHIESVVRLGIQAAEALHYAHQCGVIHRDIKPSNLMIDARANLWITDFGLARCQQTTPMSVTGDLMGTLRYMSPEQASGRVHAVDHRTDIYSLGITLYELLTLELAFDAPNRLELIALINHSSPTSLRKLNPAVPADLETILGKAITHQPLERYESAGELAEDLQRFLRGEQPMAKRPTLLDHGIKWAERHKSLFVGIAAALFLMICGLSFATVVIATHQQAATLANERADLHLMQTNRVVQNFGNLVVERLSEIEQGEAIRKDLLGELQNYYVDFIRYAEDQPALMLQLGEAHYRLAGVYYQLGQLSAAHTCYEQAIATFQALPERSRAANPAAAAIDGQLAKALSKLAALQSAGIGPGDWETSLNEAITLQRQLINATEARDSETTELAALLVQRGDLLLQHHRDGQAAAALQEAIAILQHHGQSAATSTRAVELEMTAHNNLASIVSGTDPEHAGELLQQAISSAGRLAQSQPDDLRYQVQLARVLGNAASLAVKTNQTSLAEDHFGHAIQHWKDIVARAPQNDLHRLQWGANLNSFGQFLLSQGRWHEAEENFLAAIDTLEAVSEPRRHAPPMLSDLASVQNNLGLCYEKLQRTEAAAERYTAALELQDQALAHDRGNQTFLQRYTLHARNLDRLRTASFAAPAPLAQ